MAFNDVIWYSSDDAGAPVLNNAAGSLLGVLQACLVDGYGTKSVSGITVAANVATAVCNGHSFSAQRLKRVRIAGAGTAAINGTKQITVVDANTFTFAAPGVADGTITGTITAKRAPLDWQRLFTGTNKSVYRSTDPTSTLHCLRVDDTAAAPASTTGARVRMFETMTDVDTGMNPAPADTQVSGGNWWNKGANSATAKQWALIGDGKRFYLSIQQSGDIGFAGGWRFFGDLISYRSADPFSCLITGDVGDSTDVYSGTPHGLMPRSTIESPASSGNASNGLSRIATGTGAAVRAIVVALVPDNRTPGSVEAGSTPAYPSPVDGGAVFTRPVLVREENTVYSHPVRGEMPGLCFPMAGIGTGIADKSVLTGLDGSPSSTFLACQWRARSTFQGPAQGIIVFDITGTW